MDGTSSAYNGRYNGQVDLVKLLVQNGADVNAVDYKKSTALHPQLRMDISPL